VSPAPPDPLQLAREAEARGDLARAIELYQQAYALTPTSPDVVYRLGDLYERTGDRERAVTAFKHYLELAPAAPDRDAVTRRVAALAPPASRPSPAGRPPPSKPVSSKTCLCEVRTSEGSLAYVCNKTAAPTCSCVDSSQYDLCPTEFTVDDDHAATRAPVKPGQSGTFACVDVSRAECNVGSKYPASCNLLDHERVAPGAPCEGWNTSAEHVRGTIQCSYCMHNGPAFHGEDGDACRGFGNWDGKPLIGKLVECK
jgi:tetratricopeptide (TPR) repeat protein